MSTTAERATTVILSGNPRPGSRTLSAAWTVAEALVPLGAPDVMREVDLAALAGEMFSPEAPRVQDALDAVAAAKTLVVATPIYKASYTGLLKAFVDRYRAGDWNGIVAVPVVVAGTAAHLLAGEVHLRPLLIELGAHVPTPTVALLQDDLHDLDATLQAWLVPQWDVLRAAFGAGSRV